MSVVQHVGFSLQVINFLLCGDFSLRVDCIFEVDCASVETCNDRGYECEDAGDAGDNGQWAILRHLEFVMGPLKATDAGAERGCFWYVEGSPCANSQPHSHA